MSDEHGRFGWYELMTTQPTEAIDFYKKTVGWGTSIFEKMSYTMWTKGDGQPIGGVMELPEAARKMGAPPHWLGYVGTADVERTAEQAKRLRGEVLVPPTTIPDVGRFTVIRDPQGAVLAAWTSADAPQPGPPCTPGVGDFSWHELLTTDHQAAFAFYGELFGWVKGEAMDMGPMGTYQLYGLRDGPTLGGMFNQPPAMQAPPHWLLYACVDDVHAVAEKVKANGGKVLNGPMEVPGGDWIAQCMDPQGAAFAVHHFKKKA